MKRIFLDMDGCIVNFSKGYENRINQLNPGYLDKIGYKGDFKSIDKLMQSDFEGMAKNEKQKGKAKYRASNKFWSYIMGDIDWWINLEWMPDGKELFNNLYVLRQNGIISELNILSSPSKSDPIVSQAKHMWLDKHGLIDKFDRIIMENDKYKYAESFNDILIDDTHKKIDDWVNAGGTPIFHTSTSKSLTELNNILIKNKT